MWNKTEQPNEGIELLYTKTCLVWEKTLEDLRAVLSELEIAEEPRVVLIETLAQAKEHHFFASPTIHLDGKDIDPQARRIQKVGLGSGRPYFRNKKVYPSPPKELIREEIEKRYIGKL